MTEKIVLSVIAIIVLVLIIKRGDKKSIILTSGLTFGILITWIDISSIKLVGLIVYMLTALIISFIHFGSGGFTKLEKAAIITTGFYAFGSNLFSLMVWPGLGPIRVLSIVPITLYLIVVKQQQTKTNELGLLTIMNSEFIIKLIFIVKKMF